MILVIPPVPDLGITTGTSEGQTSQEPGSQDLLCSKFSRGLLCLLVGEEHWWALLPLPLCSAQGHLLHGALPHLPPTPVCCREKWKAGQDPAGSVQAMLTGTCVPKSIPSMDVHFLEET